MTYIHVTGSTLKRTNFTEPSLTSVHIDGAKIGRVAAQIMLEGAEGGAYGPRVTDVGFAIVRRSSA